MASARSRRRDKQYLELVEGNSKLHKDIDDLETAYMIHKHYVDRDENSVTGIIRKEIGGARWEHGGEGKVRTYKSSKDLIDQETGANQTRTGSKQSKRSSLGSTHNKSKDIKNATGNTDLDLLAEDVDQNRLIDLKTKVLKKIGSKVIRRETWVNDSTNKPEENGVQHMHINSKTKTVNRDKTKTSSKDCRNDIVRRNSLKDKTKTEGAISAVSDKSRTITVTKTVRPESQGIQSSTPSKQRSHRRSRFDQQERQTSDKPDSTKQTRNTSGAPVEPIKLDDIASQNEEPHNQNGNENGIRIGVTYTPRKFENSVSTHVNEPSSNFFATQPVEPTEIYIDPSRGQVRVTSGHEDASNNFQTLEKTRVLIQPGTPKKSIDGPKLPCSIVSESTQFEENQNELRDIFGLNYGMGAYASTGVNGNIDNRHQSAPSPFTTAKQCNTEVEFWLRGLGIPDVDKVVQIFAANEIDLTDLEFMSASQLHDMGIHTFGALDKILKGIRDLKLKPPKVKKSSEKENRKHLHAEDIAWENGDDSQAWLTKVDGYQKDLLLASNGRSSYQNDQTSLKKSQSFDFPGVNDQTFVKQTSNGSCSTRSSRKDAFVRCSSAMSNVSSSTDLGSRADMKSPSFALSTHSSAAKSVEKRPPSSKQTGSVSKGTNQKPTQSQNKPATTKSLTANYQNNTRVRRSNSFTLGEKEKPSSDKDKMASKLKSLENKPTKGVLLRTRSSSLTREAARTMQEKVIVKKAEEKKEVTRHPRARSRSADAVKRKALAGVQAAARKYEERNQRGREPDKQTLDDRKKQRRDEMAARHLQRERFKELHQDESSDNTDIESKSPRSQPTSGDREEGLESLVTVNILSTPNKSDPKKTSLVEDKTRTSTMASKSDLRRSLRRVEVARRQGQQGQQPVRPVELTMPENIDPQMMATYKVGGKEKDKYSSEPESGYKTDGSTYSQIEDRVSEIQRKIKRLKARATNGDEMTLTLVRDLQGQLQHFERLLMEKDKHMKVSRSDPENERVLSARSVESQTTSEPLSSSRDTVIEVAVNPSPTSDIAQETSSPQRETDNDAGIVRQSKKELLSEMRKEKQQHHLQIQHLQGELRRMRHTDPVTSMELDQADITYKHEDKIGEGTFSRVYKGEYQGSEVAIKQLKAPLKAVDKNYFAAEVSLLKELRHPRVVLMIGVCTSATLPMMVLELMSRGSLYNHLHDTECESFDHALYYQVAKDIAQGMNYLHSHKPEVLHLDLKSMNVLLCQSLRAKIADFGFSKLRHDAGSRTRGKHKVPHKAPCWMAPELMDKGEVTCKCDVYSFGVILWEMLTRKVPYEGCGVYQILERARRNKRPDIPPGTPEGLAHLISLCWNQNPAKRPQFKEILQLLENLAFPPAWRELFQKAGVPESALQDVQSTRTIISLVTGTLDTGKSGILHSFMVAQTKGGNQSNRKQEEESKSTSKERTSSRETTSARSKYSNKDSVRSKGSARSKTSDSTSRRMSDRWESETVSTLSGKNSSDESEFTLKDLRSSSSDGNGDSERSSDSSELSEEDETYIKRYLNKSNAPAKTTLNVVIPSLELSLQSAREEFKAERERISQNADWVSVSIDDRSGRSSVASQRATSPVKDIHGVPFDTKLRLSSALSSRGATPISVNKETEDSHLNTMTSLSSAFSSSRSETSLKMDESLNMNESARSRRRNKSRDVYADDSEFVMRESFDNLRPPSPKKRVSLTQKLMQSPSRSRHSLGSDLNNDVLSQSYSGADNDSKTSKTVSSSRLGRSRLGTVDNSQDSFFGIPVTHTETVNTNDGSCNKDSVLESSFSKVMSAKKSITDESMKVEDIESSRKRDSPKDLPDTKKNKPETTSHESSSGVTSLTVKEESQSDSRKSFAKNRESLENLLRKSTRPTPRTEQQTGASGLNNDKLQEKTEKVENQTPIRDSAKNEIERTACNSNSGEKKRNKDSLEHESVRVVLKDMNQFERFDTKGDHVEPMSHKDSKRPESGRNSAAGSTSEENGKQLPSLDFDTKEEIRVKLDMTDVEKKGKKPIITPRRSKMLVKSGDNDARTSCPTVSVPEKEQEDTSIRVTLSQTLNENKAHSVRAESVTKQLTVNQSKSPRSVLSPRTKPFTDSGHEKQESNSRKVVTLKSENRKSKVIENEEIPSPKKNTIRVKLRKDPIESPKSRSKTSKSLNPQPVPSRLSASPIPPPPPPPPPIPEVSQSVAIVTRSVQHEGPPRQSMSDELKLRLAGRQSISEGMKIGSRHKPGSAPIQRPVRKQPMSSVGKSMPSLKPGSNPRDQSQEADLLLNISELDENLIPQQSDGLPSFMVQSLELQGQKDQLRSISKPHHHQLDDLSNASQEQLSSIADILKKAVMNRRLALGEDGDSVTQSMESAATGWSIDTCT